METPDPNPFPELNLGVADKVKSVAKKVMGLCTYYPVDPETAYPSEHRSIPEPTDGEAMEPDTRGAEAMLGRLSTSLNVQQTFGWDSEGCYIDKTEYEG
jgi:hypothetical protein